MLLRLKNKEYLIVDEFKFKCSIGKKGLNSKKKEGDHCTPIGVFKICRVYYRPDRIKKIDTSLKKMWREMDNKNHRVFFTTVMDVTG